MKKHFLIVFLTIAALCSCQRELTVVNYNVGVFHKYDYNSTSDVAGLLKAQGADVVGLCELDSCTVRTGGVHQIEDLRSQMSSGWKAFFSKALNFQGGAYGLGIMLSPKYKVLDHYTIHLPKAGGTENRVACVVDTKDFVYAVTHLEHTSEAARIAQVHVLDSVLVARYGASDKPVILSGDFNAKPESDVIAFMQQHWSRLSPVDFTYSTDDPHGCIDYIFLLNNAASTRTECVRNSVLDNDITRRASDHFPVLSTIQY